MRPIGIWAKESGRFDLPDTHAPSLPTSENSVKRRSDNSRRGSPWTLQGAQKVARRAVQAPSRHRTQPPKGTKAIYQTVSGSGILRSSSLRSSEKFAYPAFFSKVPHSPGHCVVGCSVANKNRRRSRLT